MSTRTDVRPFAPMRTAPEAPRVTLSAEDMATWRAAVRARLDATRAAELVAMKARLAVGEAVEAEIAMVRAMAARYGFDAERPWSLTPDGTLVEQAGGQ